MSINNLRHLPTANDKRVAEQARRQKEEEVGLEIKPLSERKGNMIKAAAIGATAIALLGAGFGAVRKPVGDSLAEGSSQYTTQQLEKLSAGHKPVTVKSGDTPQQLIIDANPHLTTEELTDGARFIDDQHPGSLAIGEQDKVPHFPDAK